MAVYLDKMKYRWRDKYWTHMVADSIDELHIFAKLIGVKCEYFDKNDIHPHYDINMMQVQIALINGARFIERRELIEVVKKLSFEIKLKNKQMSLFD